TSHGDEICEAMLYPVAHRLITRCDALYRIAGASRGADMDIEVARQHGLTIYPSLESIPAV
ncbi:MAG: NUDIX hydrolase, partial [Enterobacteriaceae bacterium]|nr:NUDIX hydrolase [Enterobacteriaceae bacterium]